MRRFPDVSRAVITALLPPVTLEQAAMVIVGAGVETGVLVYIQGKYYYTADVLQEGNRVTRSHYRNATKRTDILS